MRSGRRSGSGGAALLAVVVLTAGCGSRLPRAELERTLGSPVAGRAAPAGPSSGGPVRGEAPPPTAPAGRPDLRAAGGAAAGHPPAHRPATDGTLPDGPRPLEVSSAASGPTVTGAGAGGPAGRPEAAGSPRAPGTAPEGKGGGPAGGRPDPVVIGSVGTLSGPVGAAMQGGPLAVRVWARARNAAGGLGGRPVEVIVADDGGDPFRYQAILRELVEHHGVVAFVSNMAAFTLASGAAYLEAKRVPVIGGDLTSAMWHSSPMFFPQAGGEQALVWGMVANAAATGRHRFGSLACQESTGCTNAERYWFDEGWVAQAGMEPAYRARISIAQPDYTAECLTAQRAGVEALAVVADGATARRVATSCARQGYHPLFSIAGPAVDERLAGAGNDVLDGAVGAVATFPYVLAGTPATDEFHAALARFGTGEPLSAATAQGWVSAKLFERAAAGDGPVTPERILAGLWSLRGENLGGLTAPRTFVREGKNPDLACFFVMKLANRGWTAPQGNALSCRP